MLTNFTIKPNNFILGNIFKIDFLLAKYFSSISATNTNKPQGFTCLFSFLLNISFNYRTIQIREALVFYNHRLRPYHPLFFDIVPIAYVFLVLFY